MAERVNEAIWACWYDLTEDGRKPYLSWLYDSFAPALLDNTPCRWAAHYEAVTKPENPKFSRDPSRRMDGAHIGHGTQFLLLVGAPSAHDFFAPEVKLIERNLNHEDRDHVAGRAGSRACIFVEEAHIDGPDLSAASPDGVPGPVIQMGSFAMKTIDYEWELGPWYAQDRLPGMGRMPGCIQTRKLVSIAGWAKHSVLYEFTSMEKWQENFRDNEDDYLGDNPEWSRDVINNTVHAPGSPTLGKRIWPQ